MGQVVDDVLVAMLEDAALGLMIEFVMHEEQLVENAAINYYLFTTLLNHKLLDLDIWSTGILLSAM
ncbi:Uncharacterized protein APZ42_000945 [Daphnia magna]|uniref:Uncharacterized protein n=1 Tax=Daphnia magna TaxID=35525 RepID=A0A164J9Z8_9CRUS|nr:Uncharacterized protein APZ42_000945 [Daphnia magna]